MSKNISKAIAMAIANDPTVRGASDYHGVRHLLLNLLAVVHRDGGQYVDAHGELKATEDAVQIVASLFAANPAVSFTQKVAHLAGDELDAHASTELRDLARLALTAQAN